MRVSIFDLIVQLQGLLSIHSS